MIPSEQHSLDHLRAPYNSGRQQLYSTKAPAQIVDGEGCASGKKLGPSDND